MAKIGKITVYVQQSRHGQMISVRTVGKRGKVALNTIRLDLSYDSQSPSGTAALFWADVLEKAATEIALS